MMKNRGGELTAPSLSGTLVIKIAKVLRKKTQCQICKKVVNRLFDELCENARLMDVISKLMCSMPAWTKLTPPGTKPATRLTLSGAQDAALHQDSQHLEEDDGRDVSLSFPDQLIAFCACFKSQKSNAINCEGSILKGHRGAQVNLSASFIDVTVSLTQPAAVATAEGSFSKLKLSKTRSSTEHDIFNGLAMLPVENNRAKTLNLSVVSESAKHEAQRKTFTSVCIFSFVLPPDWRFK